MRSADVLDRLGAASEGIGDLLIGPGRAIGIRLEQDLSPTNFLAGAFELPDDVSELIAFPIRKANDKLFPDQSLQAQSPATRQSEVHRQD